MGETELDVIIPVYRPDERFFQLLAQLACQSIPPHRIILMNTERAYWDAAGAEGREIPRLFALSAAKYFGYALGKHYRLLPKWLRERCTMNRSYWEKCA